jgi:hypothetical protein
VREAIFICFLSIYILSYDSKIYQYKVPLLSMEKKKNAIVLMRKCFINTLEMLLCTMLICL